MKILEMKILELNIKGFRSLKEITWNPGDLNVVIGPNGSGKSNLLRLLEMISVSAQGRLGKYIQSSGGMEPLVWDGNSDRIEFRIKTSHIDPTRKNMEEYNLTYNVKMARLGKSSAYRIDNELLDKFYRVEQGSEEKPYKLLERLGLSAWVFDEFDEVGRKQEVRPEHLSEEESLLSSSWKFFPLNVTIPLLQGPLAELSIYHDLQVNRDAVIRQSTVTRLETRVDPDGQNLISVLHTLYTGDRDFKKNIDLAMRAAFGNDYEELVFPPAADQRIQLRLRWKSLKREQSAADLSDGTLRFLMLLAILISPSPAPIIAIDEPETGLHPSMLPIIAEHAVAASKHVQVILTTHSPQLLDAFGDEKPVTTVTQWVNGETKLKTLEHEKLERWLEKYSLGELYSSGELEDFE